MTDLPLYEKRAFLLQVKAGAADEYERRHRVLSEDLKDYFRHQGVRDYSIYLDKETGCLFASQWRLKERPPLRPQDIEALRNWQDHMADLLMANSDGRPLTRFLRPMFWLE